MSFVSKTMSQEIHVINGAIVLQKMLNTVNTNKGGRLEIINKISAPRARCPSQCSAPSPTARGARAGPARRPRCLFSYVVGKTHICSYRCMYVYLYVALISSCVVFSKCLGGSLGGLAAGGVRLLRETCCSCVCLFMITCV